MQVTTSRAWKGVAIAVARLASVIAMPQFIYGETAGSSSVKSYEFLLAIEIAHRLLN